MDTNTLGTKPRETKRETTRKIVYPRESYLIQGACFSVYKQFRNTQKESIYKNALIEELKLKGLTVEAEKKLPIYYLNKKVGVYIPDLVINNLIFLELKAKPFLHDDDIKQFWYYLKNSQYQLGYLINFGEPNGVKLIRRLHDKNKS